MESKATQRRACSDGHHRAAGQENSQDDHDAGAGGSGSYIAVAVHTSIAIKDAPQEEAASTENGLITQDDKTDEKDANSKNEAVSSSSLELDNNTIRIKHLKLLWILFQSLWPVVLLTFCDCDYISIPQLLVSYATVFFVFWLISCVIRGNNLNDFINININGNNVWWRNFEPSLVWIGLCTLGELFGMGELDLAALLLLYFVLVFIIMVILVSEKIIELGLPNIYQGLIIQLSGKFDVFKRWMAKMFPVPDDHNTEVNDADDEEREKQHLKHLEDLSKNGKLKKPTWILVALVSLILWQVGFLLYLHVGVLGDWLQSLNYQDGFSSSIPGIHTGPNTIGRAPHSMRHIHNVAVELKTETFE